MLLLYIKRRPCELSNGGPKAKSNKHATNSHIYINNQKFLNTGTRWDKLQARVALRRFTLINALKEDVISDVIVSPRSDMI